MGWASGSRLLSSVVESIKTHVSDKETRSAIYVEIVDAFEDFDCDTLDECMGIDSVFDEYLKENGWDHLFGDDEE
jgi:hypothetical protein